MKELNQQEGITFLFSIYDQKVVNEVQRIIEFEDGQVKSSIQQIPSS